MTIRVSAIKLVMDNCWDMAGDMVGDYMDDCGVLVAMCRGPLKIGW